MKNDEKHTERDGNLPEIRQQLLNRVQQDLEQDLDVLAIYLTGSLARGNADRYSDIDIHIIVKPEKLDGFIADKFGRAGRWGNVLFYEGIAASPVIVSHFDCFVKVDSWYQTIDEIQPSIWLKGMKILYDPHRILEPVRQLSEEAVYTVSPAEVGFWRTKMLAFIHETYRAGMRDEPYYALANLDSVRWLMAYGWYMEMGEHLDSPYQVWSKIEGPRSLLREDQLQRLAGWSADRDVRSLLTALGHIATEFVQLNKTLSRQAGVEDGSESVEKALNLVL